MDHEANESRSTVALAESTARGRREAARSNRTPMVPAGPEIQKTVQENSQQYDDSIWFYTDRSCTNDGRTTFTCLRCDAMRHTAYAAEIMVILKAFVWVLEKHHTAVIVFNDCLVVSQSVMQQRSQRRPMLLRRLLAVYEDDRSTEAGIR